nr:uncharacterized protein LOC106629835 [Zonotrichia albicollis]
MMPSHSGIGGSRTTALLPPLPAPLPLPLPLLPPGAPDGRASLVRATGARAAGTCGAGAGAAGAAPAGGPSRDRAVRSGGGREEASLNRGSSKGTGLIPSACPGLNQVGRRGGEKSREHGIDLGRGGAGLQPRGTVRGTEPAGAG